MTDDSPIVLDEGVGGQFGHDAGTEVRDAHGPVVLDEKVLGQLAVLLLTASGIAALWRGADGLYWLGPGCMLCYVAALS